MVSWGIIIYSSYYPSGIYSYYFLFSSFSSYSDKIFDICLQSVIFLYLFSTTSCSGSSGYGYGAITSKPYSSKFDSLMTSFWDAVKDAGFNSTSPIFD